MGKNGRRNRGARKNSQVIPKNMPPTFEQNPRMSRRIRYKSSGGSAFTITVGCLLSLLSMASSATTARVFPISAIKIKRIRIWVLDPNPSSLQEVFLVWAVGTGPANAVTAMGNVTNPAYVDTKPPVGSYAKNWFVATPSFGPTSADVVLSGNITGDFVLDLHFDYVLEGHGVSSSIAGVGTLNAAAAVYYWHLDSLAAGLTAGTQTMTPVDFTVDTAVSRAS